MLVLRANALCGGVSGVRPLLVEKMIRSCELLDIVKEYIPDFQ